jgi:hypothetical protein
LDPLSVLNMRVVVRTRLGGVLGADEGVAGNGRCNDTMPMVSGKHHRSAELKRELSAYIGNRRRAAAPHWPTQAQRTPEHSSP